MLLGNSLVFDESTVFRSLRKDHLTFNEVYKEIIDFIKSDVNSSYKISIGTDSQVGSRTVFVTCIHVHRIGKGAIGFLHKSEIARPIKNLREKIYLETCASLQLAYLFDDEKIANIHRCVKSRDHSKGVAFEFHIDVGTKGETKTLINEMVGMVKGLNFVPKIKPESYCASSFADRYTKAI
ncbi:MAG: ribonuclease H-like YkuK family protein [Clostridiales bacterium]|nr:ribonuclease H-like YkuK family protein [Eubacteriales bacterium]MDH7566526.1 ribonuclease H-like YkuK family protein [Clostridiales bacterium]